MSYQRLAEISDDLISEATTYTFVRSELFKALEPQLPHLPYAFI